MALSADALVEGENVLALEVHGPLSQFWGVTLHAILREDPDVYRRHFAAFRAAADGADALARVAYLDGRLLERQSRHREAVAEFRQALDHDPNHAEPTLRLAESLRALADPQSALDAVATALARDPSRVDLWQTWLSISLVDLSRSPADILTALPTDSGGLSRLDAEGIRWVFRSLLDCRAIRINCGGEELELSPDEIWGEDRFFSESGHPDEISGSENNALYQTSRSCWLRSRFAYRIPLPVGSYRVTLHFAPKDETFLERDESFDVHLEDARVGYQLEDLAAAATETFPDVDVTDGFLDIQFVARGAVPEVCAIEIDPTGDEK